MRLPVMFGRDEALATLLSQLQPGGLVTIKGPPGVGKTTLLNAVAAQTNATRLNLDGPHARRALLSAIASAANVAVRVDDESLVFGQVLQALDRPGRLLAVDGPGVTEAPATSLFDDLLLASEHLTLVVCSARALGSPLESVFHVQPLEVDAICQILLAALSRLNPSRHEPLTEETLMALARATDGLPLAAQLVAARVAALGVNAVSARHWLVTSGLDASISHAVRLLTADAREALGALSVVTDAMSSHEAFAVIGKPLAHELLEQLVAASLVQSEGADTFRLLDAVREYAQRTRLADPEAAKRRHCVALASTELPRLPVSFRRRQALLSAWETARAIHEPSLLLRLTRALDLALLTQGPGALHQRVLWSALELTPPEGLHLEDQRLRLDVTIACARFDAIRGRHQAALQRLLPTLNEAHALKDDDRLGWASVIVSYSAVALGHLEQAREAAAQALALAKQRRNLALTASAERVSAGVALLDKNETEAEAGLRRSAAAARIATDSRLEGLAHGNLAMLLLDAGRFDACAKALKTARHAFETAQDAFHLARLAVDEARLASARNDPAADTLLTAAIDSMRATDALDGELLAREASVKWAQRVGNTELAQQRLDALEAMARLADDVSWPERIQRLQAHKRQPPTALRLQLTRDGAVVHFGSRAFDFSRRGPLRRVLTALAANHVANPGKALTAADIQEAGWPGERMFPDSAAARVYMAIRRLRELGLESVLVTTDEGYRLAPQLGVQWLPTP
jgi:tetratricopeptide (TPR) repeat protein